VSERVPVTRQPQTGACLHVYFNHERKTFFVVVLERVESGERRAKPQRETGSGVEENGGEITILHRPQAPSEVCTVSTALA
jgi:hypothetical protein